MNHHLIALAISLLAISNTQSSLADDIDAAAVEAISRKITAIVPSNWICEHGQTGLVLRRAEEPVIINITNAPVGPPVPLSEEFRKKYVVDIKYRIVLRLGPKIEPEDVQKMIVKNQQIQRQIVSAEKSLRFAKGTLEPPRTPDEQANRVEFDHLVQSVKPIPNGYLRNVSVYIEPTDMRFVSFLSDATKTECEMVIKRVADSLTRYQPEPEKPTAK